MYEYFRPTQDGTYTITYRVIDRQGLSSELKITIPVGKLSAPELTVETTPSTHVNKDYRFVYSDVTVKDFDSAGQIANHEVTVTRMIFRPDGTPLPNSTEVDVASRGDVNGALVRSSGREYVLEDAGTYRIVYTAEDKAGNRTVEEFSIVVAGNEGNPVNTQIISAVLIIAAILLIVFLLLYFFRFRKIKE